MHITGLELVLDLYHCQSTALGDPSALEHVSREALGLAGFEVVDRIAHHFPDQGITLVLILAQSHATVHTWPEAGFVTVDVYACGPSQAIASSLEMVRQEFVKCLAPRTYSSHVIERGLDIEAQRDIT